MVQIQWVDATCFGGSGWNDPEEIADWINEDLPLMYTVGFVIKETEAMIVVADSLGPHEVGQVNKIPTNWVKSIHRLKFSIEEVSQDGKRSL